MKDRNLTRRIINIALIVVAVWIIVIPGLLAYVMVPDSKPLEKMTLSLVIFGPLIALFLINYYVLCPHCFFIKGRKAWFFIINIVIIFGWRLYKVFQGAETPTNIFNLLDGYTDKAMSVFYTVRWTLTFYHSFVVLIQHLIVASALALCYVVRNADMKEALEVQKRNAMEAELTWLKNQLNPHFLFNTLNNISSLAAIDSEKTQDSIAQLSDLLRYVLYESNKNTVPLSSEVSFMKDYIELMKLRCNDKTTIEACFDIPESNTEIAPLLFISLIENAFKHGVNARMDSFINIKLSREEDNSLLFVCENSLHEKSKTDLSGSGIGIQNMQKRLDLIYPNRYEFNYGTQQQKYVASLIIKDMFN